MSDHIARCDFILLPSWSSNHWMICYALCVVMGGHFDFAESDMAAVTRWWCLLLLTNYPVKSDVKRRLLRKRRKTRNTGELEMEPDYISKMPPDILRYILVNVVKEDGDVAFFRLSLTCWLFHGVVCEASFRKEAHFAWLDSVANWSAYSSDYKEIYRVPYKLTNCLWCGDLFKDFPPAILEMEGKESLVDFTRSKSLKVTAQQTASSVTAITIAPRTTSFLCYI